jgi:hypothetical protein
MAQAPYTIEVEIAAAGTAQRVVTSPSSIYRYVKSASFCPKDDNAGFIFVGDADVSSSFYASFLDASKGDQLDIIGDTVFDTKGNHLNYIDLYETWVDAETNGDVVFVSILR